jgi:hypothetical protein
MIDETDRKCGFAGGTRRIPLLDTRSLDMLDWGPIFRSSGTPCGLHYYRANRKLHSQGVIGELLGSDIFLCGLNKTQMLVPFKSVTFLPPA